MDHFEINRQLWNKKTGIHLESDFYDNESFLAGRNTLNSIELDILGDVKDKSVLHLQCHFGQDSMSLSRMGAKVTGVDISDEAIKTAQGLAKQLELDTSFVCCNVYDTAKHVDEQFDIIFTSYGTIGWLPDMDQYFQLIHKLLKPGGQFVLVEFHPYIWMWDENFEAVKYSYFNKETIIEELEGTYTDRKADIKQTEVSWNHDLGEVFSAALANKLSVSGFQEYDYSPYDCFNKTVKSEEGFQIEGMEGKIPMLYALVLDKQS